LLKHHSMDRRVLVKAIEPNAHVGKRRILGQAVHRYVNADALAGSREVSHVRAARFVLADEDDHELGMNPGTA
jgi:hypothetical protein